MDTDKPVIEQPNGGSSEQRRYWLDDSRNVNKIVYALYAICALLVAADWFYHKHIHFDCESWFGFFGFFGFVAYVGLVLTAKLLRRVLMRREDYYD